jgi:hypothetical protein
MPPCKSPTVFILLKSTPIVTRVCAISGERRVTITVAPSRRRGFDGLHEPVGDCRIDRRHTGNVHHSHLAAVLADAAPQLLGQLACALRIDETADRQDQQALAHAQHRRRQFANGFLLLADDALALLHEADGYGIGDAVGGGS